MKARTSLWASLKGANLADAGLTDATLKGAKLAGAKLVDAKPRIVRLGGKVRGRSIVRADDAMRARVGGGHNRPMPLAPGEGGQW